MNQFQSPSSPTSGTSSSFTSQAEQWLGQGNMSQMLAKLPASLKNVGNSTLTRFNKLSTTQKVVGGALLALGAGYLTTRSRRGNGQAATLNELLYFVNDRVEGYQRAADETQDIQLRSYYKQLVSQSQQFANQLNAFLSQEGGGRQTSTTFKGKLYRAWMDAKAAVTGFDEQAILDSNIYGEEWALKAYQEALDDKTLTGPLRRSVEHQYEISQRTYQELKNKKANR
ncbi:PA2169 family four-helix-bundle protein [Hymenobacter sp. BT683]|uniref:PA2169 family four-helix-bundle protein n=1 Tax=Hymenobacter jeongseonensis TaxID=2791027 RepID=A0ABS0IDJ9_9BACT|nr:PA2169 family four-helix-bundle protein [Hymenobacter jeongseonensis]MBF9236395.1 PA2169 family four-helix-bundle protein [Hymenobacter jeongseonensis]